MTQRQDSTVRPRAHQVQALVALQLALTTHDRAQLVMACGTGKTLTARWYAESSEARSVLVLVPSLALLAQTLTEWRRLRSWPFDALVVCSDPSTAVGRAERSSGDLEQPAQDAGAEPDWAKVRARVTTDATVAGAFLTREADRPRVVFSTYHSAPVIAAAQRRTRTTFDLAICDEAHRLAGSPREEFRVALDQDQILAARRVFMTATPRVSTAAGTVSMADETIFGPVAHTVRFGDAIRAGLLCDYRVAVLGTTRDQQDRAHPAHTVPAAILDAIDAYGLRRVLTFHGRVEGAAALATTMNGITSAGGCTISARSLDGSMPTKRRSATLSWLADKSPDDEVRLVTSARVLAEGIDVPAVDAVCFANPRTSVIDVIQAVGRALRPHPGKRLGHIIVPVVLPPDEDDDSGLLASRYGVLWSVLRALRSHDERFADELNTAVASQARGGGGPGGYRPARIDFRLPEGRDPERLRVRLVDELGDAWERYYAATWYWAVDHDGRRLPRLTSKDGMGIGEWALKQRQARNAGLLPQSRVDRLERIPGWFWDRGAALWGDTMQILHQVADQHGSIEEAHSGRSIFEGKYSAGKESLGVWLARQRQHYRDGTLPASSAFDLEQLPGWTWVPAPAEDLAMVDALRQFVAFEKHADVPAGHIEDDLELGRWVWDVRRRKLTGTLHPALEAEIWAASPSRWGKGERVRWQWDKNETQWRLAYTALLAFQRREGHAAPSAVHREELPDTTVRLGQWVSLQRFQYHRGELTALRVQALQRLPGWRWVGDVGGTADPQEPLDLPADVEHGTMAATRVGCKCDAGCRELLRTQAREYKARQRARAAAGNQRVGARLREHVAHIERELRNRLAEPGDGRGRGRRLIATTADVPLGVVRSVLDDPAATVSTDHRARLQAVTAAMCMSHVKAGSRGRARAIGLVEAGPTRDLIEDMVQRGFDRAWIGRELGYVGSFQLPGDKVAVDRARKIKELHRAIGELEPPKRQHATQIPRLADLQRRRAS